MTQGYEGTEGMYEVPRGQRGTSDGSVAGGTQ